MIDFPQAVYISTNGIKLAVHEAGKGRPVVLCHGFPEIAFSWRYQVEPLVSAGYHVIIPDQRGYNTSDRPAQVEDYDIVHLSDDLVGLLDHFGYEQAVFVGHDWGAIIVWNLAMLHPERVAGVINLSVSFMERGPIDWVSAMEKFRGDDFYIVHFNRQPGVADAAFASNPRNLLWNLYRAGQWNEPKRPPKPGMALINMVTETDPSGQLIMSEEELEVFVRAFETSGFTGPINWYRNFTRNWEIIGHVPQRVEHPSLMIYGRHDMVRRFDRIGEYVSDLEIHTLECGHWIQQEKPDETNHIMLDWLSRRYPATS
ncbi:MAG: alpha/beta hydrolase [Deltaproteobacteria bacterium]|nr:alpha/beta hydrolase [Deltaproteobacteria bacterium]